MLEWYFFPEGWYLFFLHSKILSVRSILTHKLPITISETVHSQGQYSFIIYDIAPFGEVKEKNLSVSLVNLLSSLPLKRRKKTSGFLLPFSRETGKQINLQLFLSNYLNKNPL